jgi:hypothetical protein
MSKLNIEQVELQVSRNLNPSLKSALQQVGYSVPQSYRVCVSLVDASGRKKRSTAGADNWSPDSGRLEIWLEPCPDNPVAENSVLPGRDSGLQNQPNDPGPTVDVHPALVELVKALDRAESRPGWNFVSLKKFRDEFLPSENLKVMQTDVAQQEVLRRAIEDRLILTSKVPNPKSPQFPVTAIRLNRLMPQVKRILGQPDEDSDFHPVEIRGEPMSATIIRERHQQ